MPTSTLSKAPTGKLTPQQLKQWLQKQFDSQVLRRGTELYQNGHVIAVNSMYLSQQCLSLFGEVRGSRGGVYHVSANIEEPFIYGECTCPYGLDCKHALALCLAYAAKLTDPKPSPPEPHITVDQWLDTLKKEIQGPPRVSRKSQQWHRLCLLDTSGTPALGLAERYLKKDGQWGSLRRLYYYGADSVNRQANRHETLIFDFLSSSEIRAYHTLQNAAIPLHEIPLPFANTLIMAALNTDYAVDAKTLSKLTRAETRPLELEWVENPQGFRLEPRIADLTEGEWQWIMAQPPLYRTGNSIGQMETTLPTEFLQQILLMPNVPGAELNKVKAHLAHLIEAAPLTGENEDDSGKVTVIEQFTPEATLLSTYSKLNGFLPALKAVAAYGPIRFTMENRLAPSGAKQKGELVEHEGQYYSITRDYEHEALLCRLLRLWGLIPYDYGEALGELWVPSEIQPHKHIQQWHLILPKLEAFFTDYDWHVEVDSSYKAQNQRAALKADTQDSVPGWFDLQLNLTIGDIHCNTADLFSQWLESGSPTNLPIKNSDEQWVLADMSALQPLFHTLMELYNNTGFKGDSLRLPTFKIADFNDLEEINFKQAPSLKNLQQQLKNFKGLKSIPPSRALQAELRDYQQKGLDWLMFLFQHEFGGILADDMGLGKTLQTLAFIQKLKASRKLSNGALIVAPTSLIWNWLAEANKFTPNLKCLVLHGSQRAEYFAQLANHDVIITTYALVQRDAELYHQHHFTLTVLDEAQNIKNRNAKTTRMVKQLPSRMRLALTGTPLENHLGELWSIMDFALPGLLGNHEFFSKHYRTPIEQMDADASKNLSKKVAPFMLRRTKDAVATELPEKTEIVQHVQLENDQKSLYESIRVSMEKRVRELIKQKGVAKSHIEFLDALLKLRQACIDPRLVKLSQAKKVKTCAKMEWLTNSLPEMVDEGRKILVFSQFTEMLDLIETELEKLKLPSVKLTGSTRNRQEIITTFQQGDVPIFLISLKAGGAGLNLTAADTVIHVDPWWNPAVENQATDRAHRIGQDKPVFVYKLVASATIEEKIQLLQKEKQALADNLFDETKKARLPKTGEELIELFK